MVEGATQPMIPMIPIICFIFRRDLRIHDNRALSAAVEAARKCGGRVMPLFIFNPAQVDKTKNPYYGSNAVQFMCESLVELGEALGGTLVVTESASDTAVLARIPGLVAVAWNSDLTPFARNRDAVIKKWCEGHGIETIECEDYTIFPINSIKTGTGKFYEVYTPFYRKCIETLRSGLPGLVGLRPASILIHLPELHNGALLKRGHFYTYNTHIAVRGGRTAATAVLKRVQMGAFSKYDKLRDFPAAAATTKLSAYLKFGCVSVREVLHAFVSGSGLDSGLVRELLWREFYNCLVWNRPDLLKAPNASMKKQYDKLVWNRPGAAFKAWCEGRTGFPIVDAGIRQMLTTGYMHNRVRMIVAMFLVKDLHVDWRHGERFFAQWLVDYDPAQNSGGWQWSASVGADAQPYFRVFNPWLQSSRYDPDAIYIKRWVPELAAVAASAIHKPGGATAAATYPKPVVDHAVEAAAAIQYYKKVA